MQPDQKSKQLRWADVGGGKNRSPFANTKHNLGAYTHLICYLHTQKRKAKMIVAGKDKDVAFSNFFFLQTSVIM